MSDYDVIVIGAGHNGLTAAALMARAGMSVLCLEKNQHVGGMASTTELIKGYRFEIAGSLLFPMAQEMWDDLGLEACPTIETDVMSVNVGHPHQAPMVFYTDPERLMAHVADTHGMDAVLGMAEVVGWCEAPARALGRFEPRTAPRTLDEMFACAGNEAEREAIRTALFGSVMDVVDRYLPDRERHAMLRAMLAFLSVNSTYRGPYDPGSALCLAFAMASPGTQMLRKLHGGIGAASDHLRSVFESHGGELRRHAKVDAITTGGDAGARRVTGVRLVDGETVSAPRVVSNLDLTSTLVRLLDDDGLPDAIARRVAAIDHRAAYVQLHFALDGLPEFTGPYELLNEGTLRAQVGMFGSPEEMQRDFEGCRRGEVPDWPSMGFQIPSLYDPSMAPPGKHAASSYAFYFPVEGTREEQSRRKDAMADRVVAKLAGMAPNFPDIVDRQLTYASYAYEMMFGATGGDFCHGLLHPELMGAFRPGPRGWRDAPLPYEGLYLCSAGRHGGPGVTFMPGYNCGYEVIDDAG